MSIPTYLGEPPDAERHVRWCGRTGMVTSPPTRFGLVAARRVVLDVPNSAARTRRRAAGGSQALRRTDLQVWAHHEYEADARARRPGVRCAADLVRHFFAALSSRPDRK